MQIVAPARVALTTRPVRRFRSASRRWPGSRPTHVTYAGVPNVTRRQHGAPDATAARHRRDPDHDQRQGFATRLVGPIEFIDATSVLGRHPVHLHGQQRHQHQHPDRRPEPGDRRRPGLHGHRLHPQPAGRPVLPLSARQSDRDVGQPGLRARRRRDRRSRSAARTSAAPSACSSARSPRRTFANRRRHCSTAARPRLQAISPPGTSGASVPVTVTTAESYFTGSGLANLRLASPTRGRGGRPRPVDPSPLRHVGTRRTRPWLAVRSAIRLPRGRLERHISVLAAEDHERQARAAAGAAQPPPRARRVERGDGT